MSSEFCSNLHSKDMVRMMHIVPGIIVIQVQKRMKIKIRKALNYLEESKNLLICERDFE